MFDAQLPKSISLRLKRRSALCWHIVIAMNFSIAIVRRQLSLILPVIGEQRQSGQTPTLDSVNFDAICYVVLHAASKMLRC